MKYNLMNIFISSKIMDYMVISELSDLQYLEELKNNPIVGRLLDKLSLELEV